MVLCLCQLTTVSRPGWTEIADQQLPLGDNVPLLVLRLGGVGKNTQKDRFRRRWSIQYLGSCGGPAWPVTMNSMGFPLRWLYSIRRDTGFFPPGRERDRGCRGASTIPITSTAPVPKSPPVPWLTMDKKNSVMFFFVTVFWCHVLFAN